METAALAAADKLADGIIAYDVSDQLVITDAFLLCCWVLLDYLDVVIHVQHSEERTYYSLERIWKDCPLIPLPELVNAGQGGHSAPPGTPRTPWPQTPPRNPGRTP